MGFLRSNRPILPLAIWAMTAALAYAAGKRRPVRRKAGEHARAGSFTRRKPTAARSRT